jgi:hypothetical protein
VSFPLTAIAVCPEPVIALKAYSDAECQLAIQVPAMQLRFVLTDLIQPSFWGEDC